MTSSHRPNDCLFARRFVMSRCGQNSSFWAVAVGSRDKTYQRSPLWYNDSGGRLDYEK